jgi:hypothetical protein
MRISKRGEALERAGNIMITTSISYSFRENIIVVILELRFSLLEFSVKNFGFLV